MLSLLRYELLLRRGAIIGWGIGMTLFGAMYIAIYPEMAEQMSMLDLDNLSVYVAMGISMATVEGFLASVVIQFVPILVGVYSIIGGTGMLAGEEDAGRLELILATRLKRWQIVTMKALALAVTLFLILVIAGAGDALIYSAVDIESDVTLADMFLAVLSSWPIVTAFAIISLFLGAYLPSRVMAGVVAAVVFIASYFGNTLVGLVESLEPLRKYSLFHYFDATATVFTEGMNAGDVALLLGVSVVFLVLAVLSFERRNVTVGAWPWQRPRVQEVEG